MAKKPSTVEDESAPDISVVMAELNKKFGNNTIGFLPEMQSLEIDRLPSGSVWLDSCLGGGWPMGRLVEIFGKYSSGKSLLCMKTISEAQKKGLLCAYIDAENTLDTKFAEKLGVDMSKLIITQEAIGEETIDIVITLIKAGVKVIVLDSVAALVPLSEYNDSMEQQTIGLHARLMSKGLRKINAVNQDALIIFTNQLRDAIGAFSPHGTPSVTTGGKALGFYASVRVEVRRGDDILEGKTKVGQVLKFKVQKNKVGIPFKDGYVNYDYRTASFDLIEETVQLAKLNGFVKQAGPYYRLLGEKYLGIDALKRKFEEDPKLLKKLTSDMRINNIKPYAEAVAKEGEK